MPAFALICVPLVAIPSISQNEPIAVNGVVLKPDDKAKEGAFVLIRDYRQAGAGYISDRWESRKAADWEFFVRRTERLL